MNDTTDQAPQTQPKGPRWKRNTLIAAGAIAVVAAVVVGTTFGVNSAATAAANSELTAATAQLEEATTAVDEAAQDRATAVLTASDAVPVLEAIATDTPADLASEEAAAAFQEALDQLASILDVNGDLAVTPPAAAEPVDDAAASVEAAATATRDDAAATRAQASKVRNGTVSITIAYRSALTALDALVQAAHDHGATLTFEKAGDAERAALSASLEAIATAPQTPADAHTALTAYVAAVAAAKAAQEAAEAAEAAAAEQQQGGSSYGGSGRSGSTGSSGTGGSGGSSGSTGSGGSGGSGSGGSGGSTGSGGGGSSEPTCWGNMENACVKTPPTFITNGNYVPLASCAGQGAIGSHSVGYGGNSRGGTSYSFPWSAYVDGYTVYYVACR